MSDLLRTNGGRRRGWVASLALLVIAGALVASCDGAKCKCGASYDAGQEAAAPDTGVGSSCSAGDDCGTGLGCEWGLSSTGTCQPCGAPNQVCCGRAHVAGPDDTQTCNAGAVCQPSVDIARRCQASATDAGGSGG